MGKMSYPVNFALTEFSEVVSYGPPRPLALERLEKRLAMSILAGWSPNPSGRPLQVQESLRRANGSEL